MIKNKIFKNGGFPPLFYCKDENIKDVDIKNRAYSSDIKHNINIRQILSDNNKTFIISPDDNDLLDIVTN